MNKLSSGSYKRWLAHTGTTVGLLMLSLSAAPQNSASANDSLQFGQPLPGRPSTPEVTTESRTTEPAATPRSTTQTPSRRQSSTTRRDRRGTTRANNHRSTNRRSRQSNWASRRRNPSVANRSTAPAQNIPANDSSGGWDIPQGTDGVYFRQEAAPSRSRTSAAPATSLRQRPQTPPARVGGPSSVAQRYTVYVLGDQLSLLDKVSQLTPSAAFTTHDNQTAVSAGRFNRAIDAEARVRELSQLGLRGIIAPSSGGSTSGAINSYISPSESGLPSGAPVDPGILFDNFDSSSSNNANLQARAIANILPIPAHGTRPPVSRKGRNSRLPQAPPSLEQQVAIAQRRTTPLPAVSPLFRQTTTARLANTGSSNTAPSASGYYLNLPLQNRNRRQIIDQLITLGIPGQDIVLSSNTSDLVIGPFATLDEAEKKAQQVQALQLRADIIHSDWVIGSIQN
ncbi:MAG: hypothetical protein AAF889_06600 [Cyanobacteria bacterium P01_D01_bin.73]